MQHVITFVPVSTVERELRVLDTLHLWRSFCRTEVVPVLDRQDLPIRIATALRFNHIDVRYAEYRCELPEATCSDHRNITVTSQRPTALLTTTSVDFVPVRLASRLCGVPPVQLATSDELRHVTTALAGSGSVLLLFNPTVDLSENIIRILAALKAGKVRTGVLPAADPVDARFAVLKCLLVSGFNSRQRYLISSGMYDVPPMYNEQGEHHHFLTSDYDLLVLHGHSNPFDAGVAQNTLLCSQKTEQHTSESLANQAGLLPCFHNGKCIRTWAMCDEHRTMISSEEIRSHVIVLSGCNALSVGRSWYNARHSFAYQLSQGNSLALLATAALSIGVLELDILCVALIAEGWCLSDVVEELNSIRIETYGHPTSRREGVGPFILIGNPLLRILDWDIQDLPVTWHSDNVFAVDLHEAMTDDKGCALIRVRIPKRQDWRYVVVRSMSSGIWCRGIVHCWNNNDVLYVWLGLPARSSGHICIEFHQCNPWKEVVAAVRRFLDETAFWLTFVDASREVLPSPGSTDICDQILLQLPGVQRRLSQDVLLLQLAPRILEFRKAKDEVVFGSVWHHIGKLTHSMLRCVVELTTTVSTFVFQWWEKHLRRTEAITDLGMCPCGRGTLSGQTYEPIGGGTFRRVCYQCTACGQVGEDDGRRVFLLTSFESEVFQGATLHCVCDCRAPDDQPLYVSLVIVLESWLKDRRMIGDIVTTLVNPGELRSIAANVNVPIDLSKGLYPFAVIGVVNGVLIVWRQVIDVLTPITVVNCPSDTVRS